MPVVRNVCAVRCCTKTYFHPNVSLFRFPRDIERCKQWAIACNQMILFKHAQEAGKSLSNSYFRVCDKHFENKYFIDGKKKRLRSDAVPTLNLVKAETKTNENTQTESVLYQNTENMQCLADDKEIELKFKPNNLLNSVSTLTEIQAISCSTQTEISTSTCSIQTGRQLLKHTMQYVRHRAKILSLRKKCNALQRKLNMEIRKNKAKHEMLMELLQNR